MLCVLPANARADWTGGRCLINESGENTLGEIGDVDPTVPGKWPAGYEEKYRPFRAVPREEAVHWLVYGWVTYRMIDSQ